MKREAWSQPMKKRLPFCNRQVRAIKKIRKIANGNCGSHSHIASDRRGHDHAQTDRRGASPDYLLQVIHAIIYY